MEILEQKGFNSKYPKRILTWKVGQVVPEWLSDKAKVEAIEGNSGNVILGMRKTSTGGVEIIDSSGTRSLISTKGVDDLVCINADNLITSPFVLTPVQLKLLYG